MTSTPNPGVYADKLPPHDLNAEESVLGSVLIDADAMTVVAPLLQPGNFFMNRNRHVYAACVALFQRGTPTDQLTVAHQLAAAGTLEAAGGPSYLSHLIAATPTSVHAEHYARIVHKTAQWRAVVTETAKLLTDAYEGRGDPGESVSAAMTTLSRLVTGGERRGLVPAEDAAGRALQQWFDLATPETAQEPPVSTGLRDLDTYIGGLRRRYLYVAGGATSMGKSTVANHIAHNLARGGYPVLYATCEEPDEDLEIKEAFRTAGIDEFVVRNRGRANDSENDAMSSAIDGQTLLPLDYVDEPGLTTGMLDAYMSLAKAKRPTLFAVFVDHIALLADARERGANDTSHLTAVCNRLYDLGRKHNVAMFVLSQLNRENMKRSDFRPQLSDLRSTGALEQNANVVLLFHRQDYYEDRKMLSASLVDPQARGRLEINIAKQRKGKVGHVRFVWQSGSQRILPLTTREERA